MLLCCFVLCPFSDSLWQTILRIDLFSCCFYKRIFFKNKADDYYYIRFCFLFQAWVEHIIFFSFINASFRSVYETWVAIIYDVFKPTNKVLCNVCKNIWINFGYMLIWCFFDVNHSTSRIREAVNSTSTYCSLEFCRVVTCLPT